MANSTGRPIAPLILSSDERAYLERQVRRHRVARSLSERCRVILRCADGVPSKTVGSELGIHEHTVGKWRRRFLKDRIEGLLDEARKCRFRFPQKRRSKIPRSGVMAISRFRYRRLHFLAVVHDAGASEGSARVGCWLLSEHVRAADRLFAQAIARSFDLEDDRVVQKPIEQRSGDDGIAKDFSPFREAAV